MLPSQIKCIDLHTDKSQFIEMTGSRKKCPEGVPPLRGCQTKPGQSLSATEVTLVAMS